MNRILTLTASLALLVGGLSCNKKDEASYPSSATTSNERSVPQLSSSLFNGKWAVTEFRENRNYYTDLFRGYTFRFFKDGKIVAVKETSTVSGIWMNAANDNPNEFIIDFQMTPVFRELDAEWHIILLDERQFVLQYRAKGGMTRFLRLEKLLG